MPLPTTALASQFSAHLSTRNLHFAESTILDALAAYLSSQFIIFAGPSGTGKSSLARALATFFTDRVAVLEAEVGLTRPQDFVGYASGITGTPEYVKTPATDHLLGIAAGSLAPAVLVEEANLSVIEGYLAPLTHALSGLALDTIRWPLHEHSGPLPPRGGGTPVPAAVELSPFPRLLATLNVDATAHAPANKVAARSTVLLLDSPDIDQVIATNPSNPPPSGTSPPGHGLAEHPGDSFLEARRTGEDATLRASFANFVRAVLGERRRVSPRMSQRAMQYMGAYMLVAAGAADGALRANAADDAAENSFLHFVLPLLDAREFMDAGVAAGRAARTGGLLSDRMSRLSPPEEEWAVAADDFWTGLS